MKPFRWIVCLFLSFALSALASNLRPGTYLNNGLTDLLTIQGDSNNYQTAWWYAGYPAYPYGERFIYVWDNDSTATPDNALVVQPTAVTGAGRWLRATFTDVPQVNSDWNATFGMEQILNRPALAAVATSGNYTDLSNRPALATVATSGNYTDLSNRPTLATVATSGSYNDLSNKPSRSFANPARSLNTAFQISSTRDAVVNYNAQISLSPAALSPQGGSIYLEYADDSGFTTNIVQVVVVTRSRAIAATALSETDTTVLSLGGVIPLGKYVRLRSSTTTGTPTFTMGSSQEVLL